MDVAVIGISGEFPGAENIEALHFNLCNGINGIGSMPAGRASLIPVYAADGFANAGYLDRIGGFDHVFFGFSHREACYIDPHHRKVLQHVYLAIENAGYDVDRLNGSCTAVYTTGTRHEYAGIAEGTEDEIIKGNMQSMMASRISKAFNFKGAALCLDTSCSSSLVAVHYACNEFEMGMADYAIVAGARLFIYPPGRDPGGLPGPDKMYSFSNEATTTVSGEAVVSLLLRPLEKALLDGDIIHAVIKGSAVNYGTAAAGATTAPDGISQSQVMLRCWERAGIAPATVTNIEAHGTGTLLGDAIEVQAIDLAFGAKSSQQTCALSAVKSYIGHADAVSGLCSMVSAILSLKYGTLYPILHFEHPNRFIRFDRSAVYVNKTVREWDMSADDRRRTGINSFGVSGTNCHVVLEEAPEVNRPVHRPQPAYLVTLTAKDKPALIANVAALQQYLLNRDISLGDISHTLNTGRKYYDWRFVITVHSRQELLEALAAFDPSTQYLQKTAKHLLVFTDERISTETLSVFRDQSAIFETAYRELQNLSGYAENASFRTFAFQYCLYQLLNIDKKDRCGFIGDGIGALVTAVIAGKTGLQDALQQVASYTAGEPVDLTSRCIKLINNFKDQHVAFVEIGKESYLTKELRRLQAGSDNAYRVISLPENGELIAYIQDLIKIHLPFRWENLGFICPGERIELPGYQFNDILCWPDIPLRELLIKDKKVEI